MMRNVAMILIVLSACSIKDNTDQYAEVGKYYFKISGTDVNVELVNALSEKLIDKKYAITKSSGYAWPFFEEYSLEENVPKADLMTPHVSAHRLLDFRNALKQLG